MHDREMHCVICQREMAFEIPPCEDDHGNDCPELVCTGCGAAIVLQPITMRVWRRTPGNRVAPMQRRAA